MDNQTATKTFIPQVDGRGLDAIKAAAAVFMVIDHVNSILLGSSQLWMFLLGRLTFPLFCYALAMALYKAGREKAHGYALRQYAPRLLVFALLTEPIARFSRDIGDVYNVMFTLALGAVMAGLCSRLKDYMVVPLVLAAAGLMYFPTLFEFSAAGVMLPAAFLLTLQKRPAGLPCLILLLATINAGDFGALYAQTGPAGLGFLAATGLVCVTLPPVVIRLSAALPQTGRYLPKYFLHVFYPAHLLILWAIGHYFL